MQLPLPARTTTSSMPFSTLNPSFQFPLSSFLLFIPLFPPCAPRQASKALIDRSPSLRDVNLDSSQWVHQYWPRLLDNSQSSSRHNRWPLWESPVYQNNYLRYNPLVHVNNGQRNVQSYNNYPVNQLQQDVSFPGIWDVEPFTDPSSDFCGGDAVQAVEEAQFSMGEDWFQPGDAVPPGEELAEGSGGLTFSFAASFFANPFAVSFPGDLPCPSGTTLQMPTENTSSLNINPYKDDTPAPSVETKPAPLRKADPITSTSIATPASTASTPSTLSGRVAKSKDKPAPAKYGPEIHFVDMADKKGAQRIRNTMNSRKHRQNKLDKIRELEKKLAELEAEKEKWHQEVTT